MIAGALFIGGVWVGAVGTLLAITAAALRPFGPDDDEEELHGEEQEGREAGHP